MQFKIDRATLEDHRIEFKARLRHRADLKFDTVYPNRESTENFITAIEKLALGQAIPAGITASFAQVKAIRTAQTTANQAITAATTIVEMRTAWQTFVASIQVI